jgi:hypothetical protein
MDTVATKAPLAKKVVALRRFELEATAISLEEIQTQAATDLDLPPLRELHDYKKYVPLTMTLFCDARKIGAVFDIFRAEDLANRIAASDSGEIPSVVIDGRQRKTIYMPSQETLEVVRRFVAVQYAHIVLHLPSDARNCFISPSSVSRDCAQEAFAFARALLMPATLIAQHLALSKNTQLRTQDIAVTFGVPLKMAERRLQELRDLGQLPDQTTSWPPLKSPNRSPPRFQR